MRRRSFRGARRKRSVAWIPGFDTHDQAAGLNQRVIGLTQLSAAAANTFGAAIAMTDDTDLSLHGGEDAVIERIRGRLFFTDGTLNSGAGNAASSFQVRVVLAVNEITPGGATMPFDFCSSDGLGNDSILWMDDVIVPSTVTTGVGTGMDNVFWTGRAVLVDAKATRRLQSNNQLVLWFQRVVPAGGTVASGFTLRGGLRMLLKRPR